MNNRGILTVLSGFSGAGKGTLIRALMGKYDQYALSISATTRSPRPGETNGIEYFFLSKEEFEGMIARDELIEYAQYVQNYYGTPRAYVEEQLSKGKDVILEIEVQGALQIKEKMPDTLLLFLTPPNADELKRRLVGRGTETIEVVEDRLSQANLEAECMNEYDYLIINDNLEECVERTHRVIQSQHNLAQQNQPFIITMQKDLKRFLKGE